MKGGYYLGVVVVSLIFMTSFASASCVNDDQIIMKLRFEANSHGAVWDEQNYNVKLCYDDFFEAYTGSEAHACNNTNRILNLSALTNAHATFSVGGGYPVEICHAGIRNCEISPNSIDICESKGKKPIVYLSGATNAHVTPAVSSLGGYQITSNYPYVICCNGISAPVTPKMRPARCLDYGDSLNFFDYFGENNCTLDSFDVPKSCDLEQNCRCTWTSSACGESYDYQNGECKFRCVKTPGEFGECKNGFKTVQITANSELIEGDEETCASVSNPTCTSGESAVPCIFDSTDLPLFGIWQMIAAMGLIAGIYCLRRK